MYGSSNAHYKKANVPTWKIDVKLTFKVSVIWCWERLKQSRTFLNLVETIIENKAEKFGSSYNVE